MILFALYYGLRRSEICGLKWQAINHKNTITDYYDNSWPGSFVINHTAVPSAGKTYYKDSTKSDASEASFVLLPEIHQLLLLLKEKQLAEKKLLGNSYEDNPYVFKLNNGTAYKPDYLSVKFRTMIKRAGLRKIRFHDLRASCACMLLEKGWDLKHIQEWMRHADIETTGNIYLHIRKKQAINMKTDLSFTYNIPATQNVPQNVPQPSTKLLLEGAS